jgi:hypothetical protein
MQNLDALLAAARNEESTMNLQLERKETIVECRVDSSFAHLTPYCHDVTFNSHFETQAAKIHRRSGSPHDSAHHSCALPGGSHDPREPIVWLILGGLLLTKFGAPRLFTWAVAP